MESTSPRALLYCCILKRPRTSAERLDEELLDVGFDGVNLRLELRTIFLGDRGGDDWSSDAASSAERLLRAN